MSGNSPQSVSTQLGSKPIAKRCTIRFIDQLTQIAGRRYVLTGSDVILRYTVGYRVGSGDAVAVVLPGSLFELWQVALACMRANKILIMQAANTGLTGGSTPFGAYDRDVVVVNTLRLKGIRPVLQGRQVICLPGSTLYELENELASYDRSPHSEIGSSCIGASVFGGVCNNSGGALVQRGPAYTEAAVYAKVDANGELHLINHLGVDLGSTPEEILNNLQSGNYEVEPDSISNRHCSSPDYHEHVRGLDESTPARYNADPRGLFEASGSAGRVIVFALRLDSFEKPKSTHVFAISTNKASALNQIKRRFLMDLNIVPIAAEYMDRTIFQAAMTYAKDSFLAIKLLGTNRLPLLFSLKNALDRWCRRLRLPISFFSDKALQFIASPFPYAMSKTLKSQGAQFAHSLLLKVDGTQVDTVRKELAKISTSTEVECLECSQDEGDEVFQHRFVSAGAAIRYDALTYKKKTRLVAVDVALRRNDVSWDDLVPSQLKPKVKALFVYGHFFCNVFHLDFIVENGVDGHTFEQELVEHLERGGAQCPAEHNVGHLYLAKPELAAFYKALDPTNSLNPGIGKTSRLKFWK
ncbi:MAG: D-lactate dehydrogenase [Henriciella sp.]|nr:D-lactate dehydrogenase [Henriciella sp.]MBO6694838.1 D-lactate dehydrogenase [Henriciella sp.]